MNAGLGSLANLKASVLAIGLRESTEHDDALTALGRGVADMMQRFCNRRFERAVDDVLDSPAHVLSLTVPRYPLEGITSFQILPAGATQWEDAKDRISNWFDAAGVVLFTGVMGTPQDKLRLTFTGGYWFDDTDDGTGEKPEGAWSLPDGLQHLWHLQCQAVIERTDLLTSLSAQSGEDGNAATALGSLTLLPIVKESLLSFVRHG